MCRRCWRMTGTCTATSPTWSCTGCACLRTRPSSRGRSRSSPSESPSSETVTTGQHCNLLPTRKIVNHCEVSRLRQKFRPRTRPVLSYHSQRPLRCRREKQPRPNLLDGTCSAMNHMKINFSNQIKIVLISERSTRWWRKLNPVTWPTLQGPWVFTPTFPSTGILQGYVFDFRVETKPKLDSSSHQVQK